LRLTFRIDLSPSVKPHVRSFLATDLTEESVLIPWSFQEKSLSFRPRWLSNFTSSCSSHRESSERRNRHIFRGPCPIGCPGKCPLRDFAKRVFRDMARKFAARSASTNGSCCVGEDKGSIGYLNTCAYLHTKRSEKKRRGLAAYPIWKTFPCDCQTFQTKATPPKQEQGGANARLCPTSRRSGGRQRAGLFRPFG
jgi:hypothetical protein